MADMMKTVLPVVAGLVLVVASATAAAEAGKTCVVVGKRITPYLKALEGIEAELGGQLHRFDLEGKRERGRTVVNQIVHDGCVHVIAIGLLALDVTQFELHDHDIIYTMVSAPLTAVCAAGNIRGVSIDPPPRLLIGMLKRMLPNVASVGIVYDPSHSSAYLAEMRNAAHVRQIQLVVRTAKRMRDFSEAVDDLMGRVDAVVMVPDPTTANNKSFEYLLLETARRGIPLVGLSGKHVRDGALFAFDVDYVEAGRCAVRIMRDETCRRGAEDGASTLHRLIVNMKTAKRLGLHIDPVLIKDAAVIAE